MTFKFLLSFIAGLVLPSASFVSSIEPRHEKACLRGFQSSPTQTTEDAKRLEISDLGSMYVAKQKALSSRTVAAQLICAFIYVYAFVFLYSKTGFLMMRLNLYPVYCRCSV